MNLNEPVREKYKEFYGRNIEQMELLIKYKRIPLTMRQIIERRLNSNNNDWKNNYFDTCDAIAYGKDGKFKIVLNSKILKKMTKDTQLKDGAIKITKEEYKKIKSKEFTKDSKEEVWRFLLGNLYEPYIKMIGFIPTFYVNNNNFCLRAWCVGGLADRSDAGGGSDLGSGSGRFVGLASEMRGGKDEKMYRTNNL